MRPCVVLTGGIASGKSTVARRLLELAVPVVSADRIARALVEPGQPLWQILRDRLGADFFSTSGQLDRQRLRKAIFEDPELKAWLENLMHPRIRRTMLERSQSCFAPFVVLDIPLYAENPGWLTASAVWVVDCPENLQIERLMARDRCSREQAVRILRSQARREQRLRLATDVVDNSGSLKRLLRQVDRLALKQLADLTDKATHG